MKRKYEKPNMMVIRMANNRLLLVDSERIQSTGRYNMKYGGVDDDGELDPD